MKKMGHKFSYMSSSFYPSCYDKHKSCHIVIRPLDKTRPLIFHFSLYNVFISPPRNKQTVIRFRRIERNQIPNGNLATINKRAPFNDSTYMTI